MSMPDARGLSTDTAELAAVFTHFAENRCGTYAPLYARLGAGIAGDRDLLAIAVNANPGHIQAEPRRDPAEPRLRLTVCDAGRVAGNGCSGTTSPTMPGWNGLRPTSRPAPDLL